MSFFKSFVEDLKDEDATIAADGISSAEFDGYVDSGSYILNALVSGSIYGGIPNNKIVGLAGESSTGKTFFALGVVANFLRSNPSGGVFYFDSEAAVTNDMMKARGIDTSRVIVVEPDTIEIFRHKAVNILKKYTDAKNRPPMMMVLDSLGMLPSNKEVADAAEGKDARDMTKAQLIRGTFRLLTRRCARAKVPFLVTSHVYAKVGSYVPENEMSGGAGLKYASSIILELTKKKDRDGTEVVGNIIKCKLKKSRLTKENSAVEVKLSYSRGLDRYFGLLPLAEKYGIIKKVATRYEFPDGTKAFAKNINEEPEKYFTDEILNMIDESSKKEFLYGTGLLEEHGNEFETAIEDLENDDDQVE